MTANSRFCISLAGASLVAMMAFTGARAEPVALVLEITGAITPATEAFSEIQANSSFELGDASRLEFLHYPTCQRVVVEGGKLNLTAENFRVNKGKVIDMSRAECPERVQLAMGASGSGIGGVVLRGAGDGVLKVSQRPGFTLLGEGAARFDRIQLMQGQAGIFAAPIGKTLLWPPDQPALQPGGGYALLLTGPGGASQTVPLSVSNRGKQQAPALIQID